ncbi:hypothetical protein BU15DRAFT_75364 [Melanogaster broomeanus]|nr:hypothetical protein BU15DRAFT_75364 [Melanogaster broomeanus]
MSTIATTDATPSNISLGDISVSADNVPPLQEQYYGLTPEQAEFFKQKTGISEDDELKRHILAIQEEAYKVAPYPCIMKFIFLYLPTRLPAYEDVVKIGRTREGAILLDIGCCLGADIRKAVVDGFPAERTIGSDIHPEFWELGHKLFRTTADTFAGHFIPGDVLDPAILSIVEPFKAVTDSPEPELKSLTTLNPLHGRLSVIHASNFFHLFNEPKQLHMAHALAGLLSPEPGSIIFGGNRGGHEKGTVAEMDSTMEVFCHSPQSWTELWDGVVFPKGHVEVETLLLEVNAGFWYLLWSVKKL